MKELDIIEEVTEPTDWVSPMVPVPKANGEVRICVDLRKLNQAIQREKYMIPTFDDIIHELRGSTIFSKLDAQSGFWQIPLDPETSKLTTFITPYGPFFMKRLPFGIRSAPEIFMRVISDILEGINGVICYFDDILCHSKTKEDHEKLLTLVHRRLEEAGLQLSKEKCVYRKSEITFLGHVIDSEGCRPDPRKVEAIKEMSEPKDTAELRRYLGMFHVDVITSSWPVSNGKLTKIRKKTQEDVILKAAFDYTMVGWPAYKEDVKLAARELYGLRNELSVVDGLLLRGDCVIIPYKMRKEILDRIHDGHPGITKSRERAKQAVRWPEISKDIQRMVAVCRHCLEIRPTQPSEPLIPTELPDRPFQKVAIDICELNKETYLVSVDYYSRYIDINKLHNITANTVINKMKMNFSQHGIPEIVISDNGAQFTSQEFKTFSQEWNFNHITSSPHYPQANGALERAVQTAKTILRQKDQHLALLTYRATPIPSVGKSPAELAFGRRLRTRLPVVPTVLKPCGVDHEDLQSRHTAAKVSQKRHFDKHTHPLPSLHKGDPVLIKIDMEKVMSLGDKKKAVVVPVFKMSGSHVFTLRWVSAKSCCYVLQSITTGTTHESYRDACLALGQLEDDNIHRQTLQEACISQSPQQLRNLFAILLTQICPSNPTELWEEFCHEMSGDYAHQTKQV
ncbi:Pol polyprotein [Elysia marginata]|uniref:Pol polyprotein n=1 Tax=Elysia marginata TaxID=1093978 RepID=A0AAV4JTV6_9GAST|nr:Pol polyprotein [Elysia marginata]